jgi:glycyl-tRNA synthetase beta chain
MPDLLFELGTEELPAGACASALDQLNSTIDSKLTEARLGPQSVRVYGTPRRLVVEATGVLSRQPDQLREAKGPAKSVAFDAEGKPTGAAIGFAKKQGVPVEQLEIVDTPQGSYVLARVMDAGKPAVEVLGEILTECAKGLFFPKMMRWGEGGLRFARPIRWILALLDGNVVPMEIGGVKSGSVSRGHRFLSPGEFTVDGPSGYSDRLRSAYVMANPEERRISIQEQANRQASEAGGTVPWDEGLLDENVWLVEWPTALLGSFDPAYLDLPRPVLVTAMKKHQRFFPVERPDGKLLPKFISIRNGGSESLNVVRDGNERVLTARFADASYFYKQDQATSLEAFTEKLNRILFQEKLGTLNEKRQRLEALTGSIAATLELIPKETALAVRAARLCKADLATQMVMELPSLQGIIGREYALANGENPVVAEAIAEHYLPRSAGDSLPTSDLGKLLAVADRMDTLVGYVGLGILPSGSSDPYGLRRAAQAVVQILAAENEMPSLLEFELSAAQVYEQVNSVDFDRDTLCNDLGGLFNARISAYLEEIGIRYDLIDSALSGGSIYSTLVSAIVKRAEALQALSSRPDFVPTVNAAGRVANILKSAEKPPSDPPMPGKEGIHGNAARSVERAVSILETQSRQVERSRLKEPSELVLFETTLSLLSDVARKAADYDYDGLYSTLGELRPVVDKFFDDVMVMVDDPAIRRNRLALLAFVDALYKTLADFTKVIVQ